MNSNLIRERREALGLSQDELAVQLQAVGLDVTRATISHWETGRYSSPLDCVNEGIILAKVLKISLTDLLRLVDTETPNRDYSEAARRAALIVEHLNPEAQQVAVKQLQALQQYFGN